MSQTDYLIGIPLTSQAAVFGNLQPTLVAAGGNTATDNNGAVAQGGSRAVATARTPAYGESDETFDFGFHERLLIGDKVWLDANANGVQDSGEQGIEGVSVQLFNAAGDLLTSVLTDAQGDYVFDSLLVPELQPLQSYTVSVAQQQTPLDELQLTTPNQGGDEATDSDGTYQAASKTSAVQVTSGNWGSEQRDDADFGFVAQFNLGDRLWFDENADGAQTAGEPGVPAGVVIELRRADDASVVATTTTQATDGLWSFNSLSTSAMTPQTAYVLRVDLTQPALTGYQPTTQSASGVPSDQDSNAALAADSSNFVEWSATSPNWGDDDLTLDAGFVERFQIGDKLWRDLNGDGVQQPAEPPIADVVVQLFDEIGQPLATTATDVNGQYSFDSLTHELAPQSNYVIGVNITQAPLDGLQPTQPYVMAGNTTTDSNGEVNSNNPLLQPTIDILPNPSTIVLSPVRTPQFGDAPVDDIDFGFVPRLSLGDLVFRDLNRDGIQQPGEPGIPDVVVQLLSGADMSAPLATTATDANGIYTFDSRDTAPLVADQAYTLRVEWQQSALIVPSGVWMGTTLRASPANQGTDDALDSDALVVALSPSANASDIAHTSAAWGSADPTLDFGFAPPPLLGAEIGNFLWIDANGNGLQDVGEEPLGGVQVVLQRPDGSVVATTQSDAAGQYTFNSIVDGFTPGDDYVLVIDTTQPALTGYVPTVANSGADDELDSDGVVPMGQARVEIALTAPQDGFADLSQDAGFRRIEIGDLVWIDANNDGIQDDAERRVAGVEVRLQSASGDLLATTATNADGVYKFTSNEHGLQVATDYVIVVDRTQEQLAGYDATKTGQGTQENDSNGIQLDSLVSANVRTKDTYESDYTIDFGFFRLLEIGDKLFFDDNGDGLQSPGEPGLPGVVVQLLDPTTRTVLAETTSDPTGAYLFDVPNHGIQPNTEYIVSVSKPANHTATWPPSMPNDELDSNAVDDPTDPTKTIARISTGDFGSSDLSVDLGFVPLVSLGDFVFLDANGDGLQDPETDFGVADVELALFDAQDVEIGRTVTLSDGLYRFDNAALRLFADTEYTVRVETLPSDLQATLSEQGGDRAVDSNVVTQFRTLSMSVRTPAYGQHDPTFDIGLRRQSTIGDYVWLDANGDGVQQPDEQGLEGVTVTLVNPLDGSTVASTVTDMTGKYLFDSQTDDFLPNTDYQVVLQPQPVLSNLQPSPAETGATAAFDSNGRLDPSSGAIVAVVNSGAPGTEGDDIDFGLFRPFGSGNFVFRDTNGDGLQDAGETGIADVQVFLYARGALPGAAPLAETKTDSEGLYWFRSSDFPSVLKPDTSYDLRVPLEQPQLVTFVVTKANQGMDDSKDSDAIVESIFAVAPLETGSFGSELDTFDVGFVPDASVGDRVWDDLDGDGIQEPGEPGIGGVVVQLRDPRTMQVVATTTTSSDGRFVFATAGVLTPGLEYELVTPYDTDELADFSPSPLNPPTGSTANDSDGKRADDGRKVAVAVFVAPELGVTDDTIDFGFVKKVELGDYVWLDNNGNGQQDSGEPGIGSVLLTLTSSNGVTLATTATNAQGLYKFDSITTEGLNLDEEYFISINVNQTSIDNRQPTSFESGPSRGADSNGQAFPALQQVAATVRTPVRSGTSDLSIDFGFLPPLVFESRVWRDSDGDGARDPIEPPIVGLRVELVDEQGTVLATTETGPDGTFQFTAADGLKPGNFAVRIPPAQPELGELRPTLKDAPNVPPTDNSDGELQPTGAVEIPIQIQSFTSPPPADRAFGFKPRCGGLTGPVWLDANENGARDSDEQPLRGVQVLLFDATETQQVAQTTTDGTGQWAFGSKSGNDAELQPETDYVVRIVTSQSALVGTKAPADIEVGSSGQLRLPVRTARCDQGDVDVTRFGFVTNTPLTIGDTVFLDKNANGQRDEDDDELLPDIEVRLYKANGELVATTATDANGRYVFQGDGSPGSALERFTAYTIVVDLEQTFAKEHGLHPTYENEAGVPDGVDSDGEPRIFRESDGKQVRSSAIDVTTGDFGYTELTLDFGLYACLDTDVRVGLRDARVTFTGDAKSDFNRAVDGQWVYFQDNPFLAEEFPDVGVPRNYPVGTISGWDLRGVYFGYSPKHDQLYVAYDCFGVCGDSDGDGDGSNSVLPLARDVPDLGESETFSLMIDTDQDGDYDIIVGVSSRSTGCNTVECVGVYTYDNQDNLSPGYRYSGARLNYTPKVHCNPSLTCPDLEFTLDNWSGVPGLRGSPYIWRFTFEAFAGSFVDGGIGEDFMGANEPLKARFLCPPLDKDTDFDPFAMPPTPAPTPAPSNNCCVPGTEGGCSISAVSRCVCSRLPFCCNTLWDLACVQAVDRLGCGWQTSPMLQCTGTNAPTPVPAGGPVLTPRPNPAPTPLPTPFGGGNNNNACCRGQISGGCGNAQIEQCVCRADPFCCSTRWDPTCVAKVASLGCSTVCGLAPPTPVPAPTPLPTPAPTDTGFSVTCAQCLTSGGFGAAGSRRWCDCCAQNCGGFQQDCVADNNYCASPFRCSTTPQCADLRPTPAPMTPAPTPLQVSTPAPPTLAPNEPQCEEGSRGCVCSSTRSCATGLQCTLDSRCVDRNCGTALGSAGCGCRPTGQRCDGARLTCKALPGAGETCVVVDELLPGATRATAAPTTAPTNVVDGSSTTPTADLTGDATGSVAPPETDRDGNVLACAAFDADNDGVSDCSDESVSVGTSGRDTLIRVYDEDDGNYLIGTVLIPAEGVVYDSGAATSVTAVHDSRGEANGSPAIDITTDADESGVEFDSKSVRVCLRANADTKRGDLCLASRETRNDEWKCDDSGLGRQETDGVDLLCGYTKHFTLFGLYDEARDQRAIGEETPTGSEGLANWLIILIAILAACCLLCVILALFCFVGRRSQKERRQHARRRSYDDDDEAGDFEMVTARDVDHKINDPKSPFAVLDLEDAEVEKEMMRISAKRRRSSVAASGNRRKDSGDSLGKNRSHSIIDIAIYDTLRQGEIGINDTPGSYETMQLRRGGRRGSNDLHRSGERRRNSHLRSSGDQRRLNASSGYLRRSGNRRRSSLSQSPSRLGSSPSRLAAGRRRSSASSEFENQRGSSIIDAAVYLALRKDEDEEAEDVFGTLQTMGPAETMHLRKNSKKKRRARPGDDEVIVDIDDYKTMRGDVDMIVDDESNSSQFEFS